MNLFPKVPWLSEYFWVENLTRPSSKIYIQSGFTSVTKAYIRRSHLYPSIRYGFCMYCCTIVLWSNFYNCSPPDNTYIPLPLLRSVGLHIHNCYYGFLMPPNVPNIGVETPEDLVDASKNFTYSFGKMNVSGVKSQADP